MSEDRIMITLRLQAWERAKAELHGLLHTYWAPVNTDKFGEMYKFINDFIKKMDEEMG